MTPEDSTLTLPAPTHPHLPDDAAVQLVADAGHSGQPHGDVALAAPAVRAPEVHPGHQQGDVPVVWVRVLPGVQIPWGNENINTGVQ